MGCIENQHCTRQVLMPDLALFVIGIVLAQDGMPASAPLHSERKSQHLPPHREVPIGRVVGLRQRGAGSASRSSTTSDSV